MAGFAPIRSARRPKSECEGDADDLHHHQRRHHRGEGQPDLPAEDDPHGDDRVDRVVVDEEGQEKQRGVAVGAQLPERCGETAERHPQEAPLRCLASVEPAHRLLHVAEERDREEGEPHGHGEERDAYRREGVGDPEARRGGDHREVDREQEAAAEVAEGEAGGRDAVDLVGTGDGGQEGVVEGEARGHRHLPDDERARARRPNDRRRRSTGRRSRPPTRPRTPRGTPYGFPGSRRSRP